MKMRYLIILFIGSVMFVSCGSAEQESVTENVNTEESKPEPSQEEMTEKAQKLLAKIVDVSALNLQLNEGEKWVLSEDVFTKLMKIKQQIYVISGNMQNYEIASYNTMGSEFLDFVKTIPEANDKVTNTELQKVINATNVQCLHLVESDLQSAQIAVINLSNIYDIVPNYFDVSK